MFLNSITFLEDIRTIKKDTVIEFNSNITVISGDNGTGKSTIVQSLFRNLASDNKTTFGSNVNIPNDIREAKITVNTSKEYKKDNIIYLDAVEGLLKNLSYFDNDNMTLQISCMGKSSGEGLLMQLAELNNNEELNSSILILDEPERGLSIKQQITLAKYFKFLSKNNPNLQIIIVSHGFGVLTAFDTMYSTNDFEYITTEDYITSMLV